MTQKCTYRIHTTFSHFSDLLLYVVCESGNTQHQTFKHQEPGTLLQDISAPYQEYGYDELYCGDIIDKLCLLYHLQGLIPVSQVNERDAPMSKAKPYFCGLAGIKPYFVLYV